MSNRLRLNKIHRAVKGATRWRGFKEVSLFSEDFLWGSQLDEHLVGTETLYAIEDVMADPAKCAEGMEQAKKYAQTGRRRAAYARELEQRRKGREEAKTKQQVWRVRAEQIALVCQGQHRYEHAGRLIQMLNSLLMDLSEMADTDLVMHSFVLSYFHHNADTMYELQRLLPYCQFVKNPDKDHPHKVIRGWGVGELAEGIGKAIRTLGARRMGHLMQAQELNIWCQTRKVPCPHDCWENSGVCHFDANGFA